MKSCDCRDCMEIAADKTPLCGLCEDAGCEPGADRECQGEHAGFQEELAGEDPHAVSRFLGFELAPQT